MKAQTDDRRIQRTRAALRGALIALIMERGYEAITVQAIIDRANVGRSTFYTHYLDKHQLLLANLAELRVMLTESQQATVQKRGGLAQGQFAFSMGMLDHVGNHVPLYRAMVGKQSGVVLQREIEQILADLVRAELADSAKSGARGAIPQEVLVPYVVSAFLGLLVWWLEAGMPCAAAEVDQMFQALTLPGVQAALGGAGTQK
jgi:AcrR family transcriptional regulator